MLVPAGVPGIFGGKIAAARPRTPIYIPIYTRDGIRAPAASRPAIRAEIPYTPRSFRRRSLAFPRVLSFGGVHSRGRARDIQYKSEVIGNWCCLCVAIYMRFVLWLRPRIRGALASGELGCFEGLLEWQFVLVPRGDLCGRRTRGSVDSVVSYGLALRAQVRWFNPADEF